MAYLSIPSFEYSNNNPNKNKFCLSYELNFQLAIKKNLFLTLFYMVFIKKRICQINI